MQLCSNGLLLDESYMSRITMLFINQLHLPERRPAAGPQKVG